MRLLILLAIMLALSAWLYETGPNRPPDTRSIGQRNHTGFEPVDVFGFKKRGW